MAGPQLRQQPLPVALVDERVVIGELEEGAVPELANAVHLGQHALEGLLLVLARQQDRAGAELATPRTAAADLDGQPVVAGNIQQLESRHGSAGEVEFPAGSIDTLQAARGGILQDLGPGTLAFPQDHRIGMPGGLLRQRGDVKASHDDTGTLRPVAVGQGERFPDLGAEAGDGDEVETVGKNRKVSEVPDLEVLASVMLRRHAGEGEQTQARERCDNLAPFHEPGQREAEPEQLRITDPNSAHGNQTDLHARSMSERKSAVAVIRLSTGTKKK
jgi:hypothetical protein